MEDGPSWTPATHVRDLDEAPDSWLQLSPAPATVAIWEVNQRMERSLSRCLSLCNFAFQINK